MTCRIHRNPTNCITAVPISIMRTMFVEPLGRMMLMATVVMQFFGFLWIRQVMKIEV